jgi:hypothetical protein
LREVSSKLREVPSKLREIPSGVREIPSKLREIPSHLRQVSSGISSDARLQMRRRAVPPWTAATTSDSGSRCAAQGDETSPLLALDTQPAQPALRKALTFAPPNL